MDDEHDDRPPAHATTRRAFLGRGVSAAAATALATTALAPGEAEAQQGGRAPYGALIERLGQRAEWKDLDLRLLRRVTLGMTAGDVTAVKSLGFDRYLEEQLNAEAIDDSACEQRIATRYPQFAYSQATLLARDAVYWQEVAAPVHRAIVERAAFSRRQLKERMTEFWTDHFNIANSPPRLVDYRDVVQRHALGNFGDMVRASMRSPAMLIYLDQVWSTKYGINENYARELLELHTVGVNGGYTQQDVRDFARVLTGWTIDANRNFQYRADYHDFGAKTVMGMSFPARPQASGTAGMDEGIDAAEFLLRHPSTAQYLATKLLRWFIRPDPTPLQVERVVTAYHATNGDIKAMLRAVLTRNNLANAPAKLKRPFHYYVSAVRATGVTIDPWSDWSTWEAVGGGLWDLAHQLFAWQTPDGYPDQAEYWAGLMVNRWNAMSGLVGNWGQPGQYPRFTPSAFTAGSTPAAIVADINRRMFGGEMTARLAAELTAWLARGVSSTRIRETVYFACCAPEFQYY
jgi:uncharacterized protein (DUF1800 family)